MAIFKTITLSALLAIGVATPLAAAEGKEAAVITKSKEEGPEAKNGKDEKPEPKPKEPEITRTYNPKLGKYFLVSFGATASTQARFEQQMGSEDLVFQKSGSREITPQLSLLFRRRALFEASWDLAHIDNSVKENRALYSTAVKAWRGGTLGEGSHRSWSSLLDFEFHLNYQFTGSPDDRVSTATLANQSEVSFTGIINAVTFNHTFSTKVGEGSYVPNSGYSFGLGAILSVASDTDALDLHGTFGIGIDTSMAIPLGKSQAFEATLGLYAVAFEEPKIDENLADHDGDAGTPDQPVQFLQQKKGIPDFSQKFGGLIIFNSRIPINENSHLHFGGQFIVNASPNAWAITIGYSIDITNVFKSVIP